MRYSSVLTFARAYLTGILLVAVGLLNATTLYVTTGADSGPGSLRQLLQQADEEDVIKFSPSLANQTISLLSPLVINSGITIDGQRLNLTLDGRGATRIFLIEALEKKIHISHLTLLGGLATTSGGAIRLEAGALWLRYVDIEG